MIERQLRDSDQLLRLSEHSQLLPVDATKQSDKLNDLTNRQKAKNMVLRAIKRTGWYWPGE